MTTIEQIRAIVAGVLPDEYRIYETPNGMTRGWWADGPHEIYLGETLADVQARIDDGTINGFVQGTHPALSQQVCFHKRNGWLIGERTFDLLEYKNQKNKSAPQR